MRAPFRSLAAFATLLVASSMVPDADAADPAPAAADPAPADKGKAPADTGKSSQCSYGGLAYGDGAVICVAPKFGQKCDDKGKWGAPRRTNIRSTHYVRGRQIPFPVFLRIQCTYHDVKYSPGANICVAPKLEQKCRTDGGWGYSRG